MHPYPFEFRTLHPLTCYAFIANEKLQHVSTSIPYAKPLQMVLLVYLVLSYFVLADTALPEVCNVVLKRTWKTSQIIGQGGGVISGLIDGLSCGLIKW